MDSLRELPEEYWELVDLYRPELLKQAQMILGNLADAEDVVQDTLCEALRHPDRLLQANSASAWLQTINQRNAMDRLRNKRRDSKRMEKITYREVTTGGFSALELSDSVAKALESLPPKTREVVILFYFKHLTYKEIAARLEMPIGTIGRLLYEASMTLYDKLKVHFAPTPHEPPAKDEERAEQ